MILRIAYMALACGLMLALWGALTVNVWQFGWSALAVTLAVIGIQREKDA